MNKWLHVKQNSTVLGTTHLLTGVKSSQKIPKQAWNEINIHWFKRPVYNITNATGLNIHTAHA